MKKVLITGANSYIGTSFEYYVKTYYAEHFQINTLDMENDNWRRCDFSEYDVVFHVAGLAHADVSNVTEETKNKYYEVNTKLAIETAEKSKAEGVKQFIFMSSMIVYGGAVYIDQKTQPKPANFYGDSKWQAELKIRELQSEDFDVAVLRPPMVYGNGSKGNYPSLSKIARHLPIFPKVKNKRSMLYIENLCEFLYWLIKEKKAGVFFPQNKELVSTSELVRLIAREHGHKIWISSLGTPFVALGTRVPGKVGNLCRKAFGDSFYEPAMSEYATNYQRYNLEASVKRTEQRKHE